MVRPMVTDQDISVHYERGDLLTVIEAGLEALGKSADTATIEELGLVDEFHIGGRAATAAMAERLDVSADARVLDIGCGIGGTARFMASRFGCRVTGVDLTPEYVATAAILSKWTGLADRLSFHETSALDMPFGDATFDRATVLHVGMNIADKAALFAEISRVLVPGGRLGVYDIVRIGDGEYAYPMPWAGDRSTSFVASPGTYRDALAAAGFSIVEEHDHASFAIEFFAAIRDRSAAAGGPPPLGLHVIMGSDAPQKIANMVEAVTSDILAPLELICAKD
jgi:SAM-dependent methyltransferase